MVFYFFLFFSYYSFHFFIIYYLFWFWLLLGNSDPNTKDLIENSKQLLSDLENYHGCGIKIRDALSNSADDHLQREAYNAVCPNIEIISRFHNFSTEVGSKIGELSTHLTNVEACQSHLSELAAIGELILFCFKFDQMKVIILFFILFSYSSLFYFYLF